MPEIVANGIRIYYERTGGDKPPVVLLHGITDSGRCWPRVVAALRDVLAAEEEGAPAWCA